MEITKAKILAYQRRLFKQSYSQNKGNYHQGKSNKSFGIDVYNVSLFSTHSNFWSLYAINKDSITPKISHVKTNIFLTPLAEEKLGTIIKAPNQPAARFTNSSEKTEAKFGSNLINFNLTNRFRSVNGSN